MKKFILCLLVVGFWASFMQTVFAIPFNLSRGTDNQSSLTYSAGGISFTLNNAEDLDGNDATFGVGTQGLYFSSGEGGGGVSGDLNIDTFDVTFNRDVTIRSFVRTYSFGSGDISFTISGGGQSSGAVNIGGDGGVLVSYDDGTSGRIISFNSGDIPYFQANQVYTFDFTYGTGNRAIGIREMEVRAHTPIPEPGSVTLLGLGLLGLARWRRQA